MKDIPNFKIKTRVRNGLDRPSEKTVSSTNIQAYICWLALLPFGGLLVLMLRLSGYSVENMRAIRAEYKKIWAENKSPLIICANHLTFIDSALIMWALGNNLWYFFNYKAFTWNLPAGDFFKKKKIYHATLYLTKCIFIHRDGSQEHKNAVLSLCRYLLLKGNVILIFPEGQRSRKGFFDNESLTMGVGKIVTSIKNARVLCVYLRSDKQETYSNFPAKNSRFKMEIKLIAPVTDKRGKAGYAEIAQQIGTEIKQMETNYFARKK